jgi:hypothetical protein
LKKYGQAGENVRISSVSLESDNQPQPETGRKLPDLSVCRIEPSGIADLVYCLVTEPYRCRYAKRYAFRTFCLHPDPSKFACDDA